MWNFIISLGFESRNQPDHDHIWYNNNPLKIEQFQLIFFKILINRIRFIV